MFVSCLPRLLAGYLGYTSGLSLLCMVFFLIVVSKTQETSFLERNTSFLLQPMCLDRTSPSSLPHSTWAGVILKP